jgi:hypothetical protein
VAFDELPAVGGFAVEEFRETLFGGADGEGRESKDCEDFHLFILQD